VNPAQEDVAAVFYQHLFASRLFQQVPADEFGDHPGHRRHGPYFGRQAGLQHLPDQGRRQRIVRQRHQGAEKRGMAAQIVFQLVAILDHQVQGPFADLDRRQDLEIGFPHLDPGFPQPARVDQAPVSAFAVVGRGLFPFSAHGFWIMVGLFAAGIRGVPADPTTITILRELLAEKLIIFSRFPAAGQTKTRLIPVLGPHGAARLQRLLTERTVALARRLAALRPVALQLSHEGGEAPELRRWLGGGLDFRPQGPGDLGEKMARALAAARAEGHRRLVLVGTDCPSLSLDILAAAFDSLACRDLVLGPAVDGGYYLVGLSSPAPELFLDQPWGEPGLLDSTLAAAARLGLNYHLLQELADVDRPEDLHHLGGCPDLERS
jgi:rSAM/selenodomain-associated transferase 1